MRIRQATLGDSPAIARLVSELAREFIVEEFTEEGRETLLTSLLPAAIARNLAAGFDVLVAEEPGPDGHERLVGVVATRDDTHLFHLFVASDWQRRGLARRLWEQARDRCVERAGTRRFTVFASTHARAAYARLGFHPAGPRDVRQGVVSHPMELLLPRA